MVTKMAFYDVKDGEKTEGYALFQKGNIRDNKNKIDHYIEGVLQTKNKQVMVKIWKLKEKQAQNILNKCNNHVIHFIGQLNHYKNEPQISLDNKKNSDNLFQIDEKKDKNKINFLPSSYWDIKKLSKKLKYFTEKIIDPDYKKLVENIYKQVNSDLKPNDNLYLTPAALSMHHAFLGGLLTHTISMASEAEGILQKTIYKKEINQSLLYAGILLHDIGKAYSYTNSFDHEESKPGRLLEHVAIADGLITSKAIKIFKLNYKELLANQKIILLRHMILSHHGLIEWGAAIKPQIPEAILLHYLDTIDAHMEMMRENYNQLEPNTFSNKIFGLGNSSIFRHDDDIKKQKEHDNN